MIQQNMQAEDSETYIKVKDKKKITIAYKMLKWVVVLCVAGVSIASPPHLRSKEDIEELRNFLLKSKQDGDITLDEAMARNPKASPWENSGKYQGDIVLFDEEIEEMVAEYAGNSSADNSRAALVNARHRWPGGIIYYDLEANRFDAHQQHLIQVGINFFSDHTNRCTRWVRRTNQRDYVLITGREDGCYATVGYWEGWGVHTLNLARGCFNVFIIVHEMLHSAGFHHMHQTYNRYDWIWINWANVARGCMNIVKRTEHNFDVFNNQIVTMLGLPYEYASNQHYGEWAFSANGRPTIGARFDHGGLMGQLQFISGWDIWRLARLYNCPGAWSLQVREEDANKPYNQEFANRLREAAEKELREKAENGEEKLIEYKLQEVDRL